MFPKNYVHKRKNNPRGFILSLTRKVNIFFAIGLRLYTKSLKTNESDKDNNRKASILIRNNINTLLPTKSDSFGGFAFYKSTLKINIFAT